MELATTFGPQIGKYSLCGWDVIRPERDAYAPVRNPMDRANSYTLTTESDQQLGSNPVFAYVFMSLAEKWIKETGTSSLVGKRYSHPAYVALLELGKLDRNTALTAILKELKTRPDRWFDALRTLSRENPAEDAKTPDESIKYWLEWGYQMRLISE
jgi:hypothetical protein